MGREMKHYQDTETGNIFAFEEGFDPLASNNRNIPKTLVATVLPKPTETSVWYQGGWVERKDAPINYQDPISSLPSYNPAWMVSLRPYTVVIKEGRLALTVTLDDVNQNSYDGKQLAKVVGSFSLGNSENIDALISYDGMIAIPQCESYPTKLDGLKKLNEILCALLLGGVHVEAFHPHEILVGSLHENSLFAYQSSLHTRLRHNEASISERLNPLMHPRTLVFGVLREAFVEGKDTLAFFPKTTSFFLLNGYTALFNRNKIDAINNLWIVVEQLTEILWKKKYLENRNSFSARVHHCHQYASDAIEKDLIFAKHRMLRLSKIITKKCYQALCLGRKCRNALAHRGREPSFEQVVELWHALPELIEVVASKENLALRALRVVGENDWDMPARTNFQEWIELAAKSA